MKEYIEMIWRRSGETVRVYNFSTVDQELNHSYNHRLVTYATIFSQLGKRQGGSGWQTVEVHELTPIEFWNEGDVYDPIDEE